MDSALRGHLDDMILATLAQRAAHGYALIETLRERSGGMFDLPEGTVYPALHRLEGQGLLASRWSEIAGRRRRIYRLTRRGRRALIQRRQSWTRFSGAVSRVLGERTRSSA